MSDQSGHLLDSITGRQRLLDRFDRIEQLLGEQAERAELAERRAEERAELHAAQRRE